MQPFRILVYDRVDPRDSDASVLYDFSHVASGLRISTRVPGGFFQASFTVPAAYWLAAEYYSAIIMKHIMIFAPDGTIAFDGRVEDLVAEQGQVNITAQGWYEHLNDRVYSGIWYGPGGEANNPGALPCTIPNVVKDAISVCPYISAATDAIDPDGEMTAEFPGMDWSGDPAKVKDVVEKMISFGYTVQSEARRVRFAIWEGRMPYLWTVDTSDVRWYLRMRDLSSPQQSMSLERSRSNFANKVAVIYSDQLGQRLQYPPADGSDADYPSGWAENKQSQDKYGIIESYLSTSGVEEEFAKAFVEAGLLDMQFPPAGLSLSINDNIYDRGGAPHPVWSVRAGDIIEVVDLLPQTAMAFEPGDPGGVQLRRFEVVEARYDATSGVMSLQPDVPVSRIEVIMAMMDKGGGQG